MLEIIYASLGLMITGGIMYYLAAIPKWAFDLLRERLTVSIIIREQDAEDFSPVFQHIVEHEIGSGFNHVKLINTPPMPGELTRATPHDSMYTPYSGYHKLSFRGTTIYVQFEEHSAKEAYGDKRYQKIILWRYGTNIDAIKEYINHCKQETKARRHSYVAIRRVRPLSDAWTMETKIRKRPQDSIILRGTLLEDLIKDIRKFQNGKDWYIERGIPYRRGYLLYGPPGCGKTSTLRCIAGVCDLEIRTISLTSFFMTDTVLHSLISSCGEGCMLVIEDIDAAFEEDNEKESKRLSALETEPKLGLEKHPDRVSLDRKQLKRSGSVTLSGLLNALDGIDSGEGFIVAMTTNFPDRLDPALIRKGRIDMKINIGYPDADQLQRMYTRFFPDLKKGEACEFADAIVSRDQHVSMASIQGYLFDRYKDPHDAISDVDSLFE